MGRRVDRSPGLWRRLVALGAPSEANKPQYRPERPPPGAPAARDRGMGGGGGGSLALVAGGALPDALPGPESQDAQLADPSHGSSERKPPRRRLSLSSG